MIAAGAGGIKPNVSTMGADQFDPNIEQVKIYSQTVIPLPIHLFTYIKL